MYRFALLLSTLALVSCAGTAPIPYRPFSLFAPGYQDFQIDPTHYEVRLAGNYATNETRVWTLWVYRCAEITKENGFTYFSLTDLPNKRPEAPKAAAVPNTTVSDNSPGLKISDGVFRFGDAAKFVATGHSSGGSPVVIPGGVAGRFYMSDAVVSMYNDPLPLQAGLAYRAETVLDAYGEYVHAAIPGTPENRETVLSRARIMSPLGEAYALFATRLVIRINPGQTMTKWNSEALSASVRPRFPPAGEWTAVPETSRFVSDESVVHGQFAEISYVVATLEDAVQPDFRFDRFHVDCASFVGHHVAGGHLNLTDFQPAPSTLPHVGDTDLAGRLLEGDDRIAARTACKNAEGRT